jgi:Cu/Ag efflux protein CusF
MVSIPKIVGVLSCGFVLGLGLSTVTQAAEKSLAAERMKPVPSADRKGSPPDLEKPDEDTVQGINTIKGEVLRIKGEHFYVRRSDGKEMHLHTKPTTQMMGEFKKGDHIEAKVTDQNNALSIRQAK